MNTAKKRVLVVCGHPDIDSFCATIAQTYTQQMLKQGEDAKLLYLGSLTFDPILRRGYNGAQPLEPDLESAWHDITEAGLIVWVYPSWWGNMPALLKGFIDRVFLPGKAFKYKPNSPMWDKFLTGKSARIILTMDAPYLWNWLVYRNANIRAMKHATLQFCGIKPVKVTVFDRVRFSNEFKRQRWLSQVKALAIKDISLL
jgi:NAD(P)H dehydrogenase (quinone)